MANRMQGADEGNQDATASGELDSGFHERVIPGVAEDPRAGAIKRRRLLILLASLALVVVLTGVLVSKLIHVRKASEHSGLATAPTSATVAAAQAPKRFTQAFPVELGAAPPIELVDHGCGWGWHRVHWHGHGGRFDLPMRIGGPSSGWGNP